MLMVDLARTPFCLSAGVPQGSGLGPLLFILYTNGINNNMEAHADDTSHMLIFFIRKPGK